MRICQFNGLTILLAGLWIMPVALAQAPQNGPNHIACYEDYWPVTRTVLNAVNTTNAAMTIELCQTFCSTQSYIYYGLEYQDQCYCGNQLPFTLSSLVCDQSCFGNALEACGGNNSLSTYFTGVLPADTNALQGAVPALQANLARAQGLATGQQLSQIQSVENDLSTIESQIMAGTSPQASSLSSAIQQANSVLAGYAVAAASTGNVQDSLASLSSYAAQVSAAEATATGTKLSSLQAAEASISSVLAASITNAAQASGAIDVAAAALGIYQGAISSQTNGANVDNLLSVQSQVNAAITTAQAAQSMSLANAQIVISSILNDVSTNTVSATMEINSGIAVGLAALATPGSGQANVASLESIESRLVAASPTATGAALMSIQNAQTVVIAVLSQATGSETQTSAIPSAVSVGLAALGGSADPAASNDPNLLALASVQSQLFGAEATATGSQAASISAAEQTASAVLASADSGAAVAAIAFGLAALNGGMSPITSTGDQGLASLSMINSELLAAETTATGAHLTSIENAQRTASNVLGLAQTTAAPAAIAQGLAALQDGSDGNLASLSSVQANIVAAEATATGAQLASLQSAAAVASGALGPNENAAAVAAAVALGLAALGAGSGSSSNDAAVLASLSAIDSRLVAAEPTATGARLSALRLAEMGASSVLARSLASDAPAAIFAGVAALATGNPGSSDDSEAALASLRAIDSSLLAAEPTATGARLSSLRLAEMGASSVLARSLASDAPAAISAGVVALAAGNSGSSDDSEAALASLRAIDSSLLAAEPTATGARLSSLRLAEMGASSVLARSLASDAPAAISAGVIALAAGNSGSSGDPEAALASLRAIDSSLLAAEPSASGMRYSSLRLAEMGASSVLARSLASDAPAAIAAGLIALGAGNLAAASAVPTQSGNSAALASLRMIEQELSAAGPTASGSARSAISAAYAEAQSVLSAASAQPSGTAGVNKAISDGDAALGISNGEQSMGANSGASSGGSMQTRVGTNSGSTRTTSAAGAGAGAGAMSTSATATTGTAGSGSGSKSGAEQQHVPLLMSVICLLAAVLYT